MITSDKKIVEIANPVLAFFIHLLCTTFPPFKVILNDFSFLTSCKTLNNCLSKSSFCPKRCLPQVINILPFLICLVFSRVPLKYGKRNVKSHTNGFSHSPRFDRTDATQSHCSNHTPKAHLEFSFQTLALGETLDLHMSDNALRRITETCYTLTTGRKHLKEEQTKGSRKANPRG